MAMFDSRRAGEVGALICLSLQGDGLIQNLLTRPGSGLAQQVECLVLPGSIAGRPSEIGHTRKFVALRKGDLQTDVGRAAESRRDSGL